MSEKRYRTEQHCCNIFLECSLILSVSIVGLLECSNNFLQVFVVREVSDHGKP